MTPTTDPVESLVDVACTRFGDLPDIVVERVRLLVVDAMACMAMGAYHRLPSSLRRLVNGRVGRSRATVLGSGSSSAPEWAALVNASSLRCLDFNDTYVGRATCHPSDMLAALIAVAEAEERSGSDLIAACAGGYEALAGLCDSTEIAGCGWSSVTLTAISATAAVASLMTDDRDTIARAVLIGAMTAPAMGVTSRGHLSSWKNLAAPYAGHRAIVAAQLAKAGLAGPDEALTGQYGLRGLVTGELSLAPPPPWRLMDVRIKTLACQYFCQAAASAALRLYDAATTSDEISTVEVRTSTEAIRSAADSPSKWSPSSPETADHSLPYCVTVALVDGAVSPAQFTVDRLRDPALRRLVTRVQVVEYKDPTWGDLSPTTVRVVYRDGTVREQSVDGAPGDPRMSPSAGDMDVKLEQVRSFLEPNPEAWDRFVETIWRVESLKTVGEMMTAVNRAVRSARLQGEGREPS